MKDTLQPGLSHLPSNLGQVKAVASLVAQRLKRLPGMWETRVRSLGQEDPLEKEMATHSNTLAWRIPWTEEPGRLKSTGSQRVGTRLSDFTFHFHNLSSQKKKKKEHIKMSNLPKNLKNAKLLSNKDTFRIKEYLVRQEKLLT